MAHSSADDYGSFGSVPSSVPVNGSGAQPMNIRANPEDFGSAIGAGLQKLGATGEEVAQHYQEMAVHTATNDAYVNGYAPAVNSLVSDYKKLQGTDALQQLPEYQKQLQQLNQQYLNTGSPMQRELMGGLVSRHTISTMDNMTNHADQQYASHAKIVSDQAIKNASDEAMNNIHDPVAVDAQVNRAMGLSKLQALDTIGHATDKATTDTIDQLATEKGSDVATSVIKMAMDSRDYQSANMYYNKYAPILSGNQKLELSKQLTNLNFENNSDSMINNLLTGSKVIPPGTQQYADNQTKATVADLAQKEHFDPNIMFGIHGSESNYGKNIPSDARLKDAMQTDPKFRDKGFEDDSLTSSVHNAAKIWNENVPTLEKVLGRSADPKEGYVAYNQGGAGAVALMTAAPTDTAVQALSKIMPADVALQHVIKNGGTGTMSAKAFSDHLQDWFQTHYDAQKTQVADGASLPDAIRDHGNAQIPAIQPTTNPHDYYEQVAGNEANARAYIASEVPDQKMQELLNKKLDTKIRQAEVDDRSWKVGQAKIANQYIDDPRYTSMDQIPATVKSDLRKAGQLKFLEAGLTDRNNPKANDHAFNEGFLPTLNRVASDDPVDNISDMAKLQQTYGDQRNIGPGGFKALADALKTSNTPEGKAKIASQAQFLNDLHQRMVSGPNDTEGKANFEKALPAFFNTYNNANTNKENMGDILSFDSKNANSFIAKNGIKIPTPAEMTSKKIDSSVSFIAGQFGANRGGAGPGVNPVQAVPTMTPAEKIALDYNDGKITQQQKNEQLAALGVKLSPQAPRAE